MKRGSFEGKYIRRGTHRYLVNDAAVAQVQSINIVRLIGKAVTADQGIACYHKIFRVTDERPAFPQQTEGAKIYRSHIG